MKLHASRTLRLGDAFLARFLGAACERRRSAGRNSRAVTRRRVPKWQAPLRDLLAPFFRCGPADPHPAHAPVAPPADAPKSERGGPHPTPRQVEKSVRAAACSASKHGTPPCRLQTPNDRTGTQHLRTESLARSCPRRPRVAESARLSPAMRLGRCGPGVGDTLYPTSLENWRAEAERYPHTMSTASPARNHIWPRPPGPERPTRQDDHETTQEPKHGHGGPGGRRKLMLATRVHSPHVHPLWPGRPPRREIDRVRRSDLLQPSTQLHRLARDRNEVNAAAALTLPPEERRTRVIEGAGGRHHVGGQHAPKSALTVRRKG